jgi:hypothetical protein
MKKLFFILVINLFLLSCTQNEEIAMTNETQLPQSTSSKLATGEKVKLIKAKDFRTISCSKGGCQSVQWREYTVEVANIAVNKVVAIHQQLNTGQWEDINLNYAFTTTTGTEIWKAIAVKNGIYFTTPTASLFGEKLAVKYLANNQTYWDNNKGNDYTIVNSNRQDNSSFLYLNVDYPICATAPQHNPSLVSDAALSYVSIAADVKNIAFNKEVKVVYTTNNWATTQTKSLTFNAAENNNATQDFERWTTSFAIPKTSSVTYALCYTINGQTYWDNNFGKNYTILSNN